MVGSFITPYLMKHHDIRVLDLAEPSHDVEFVKGSMTNLDEVRKALEGVDAFIDVAMLSPQGGGSTFQNEKIISDNYQINCEGLHLLLFIAQEMGIKNGVYTSSMSVTCPPQTYPVEKSDTGSIEGSRVSSVRDQNPLE